MASSFTVVTECSAHAAAMFDISLDIDAHIDSMSQSGERAINGVTSGKIGLGQTVTWRARHFGIWFTMTSKITALDHPHRFVDEQVRGPFRSFHHEHIFEDTDTGCRMTDTITLASPVFGSLAERLILVPYVRRLIHIRNATLLREAYGAASAKNGR
ncbi:SRPBCC family protein [Microbacterium sp. YY-01]|uniref:SRPBCC family protein n=1 Tax=Microbacterium sp. YY-01 TaxID=3421634 RepID=UPI003D16BCF4